MAETASVMTGIRTYEDLRTRLTDISQWTSTPLTWFSSHWLYEGEQRLDGGYYAAEAMAAQRIVQDSGLEIKPLAELVQEVYILGRFRRVYATDKAAGWPYLSASEALVFRPESDRYLAKDHAPQDANRHFAKQGWMLVSCSGTVGRTVMVTKRLAQFFLTHDLARLVPNMETSIGYLYAFLSTWMGQALLAKDQYGSAIKHLEPHHIAAVPVPLLSDDEQRAIHAQIMYAYALRDEANDLLDEAGTLLHQELGLPRFDASLVPYLTAPPRENTGLPEIPHPQAFTVNAAELHERLDASYHIPIARTAIALLCKGRYEPIPLLKMAEGIYIPPRFKRIYVQEAYGVPFIRPSHLPQMRPFDLGYISKLTQELDLLELHKGDVLVTTDGTVGRVSLVTGRMTGWAGSNNIGRITYGNTDGRNGYVAAFLSSPYGYHQLTREIYGGVVDHIEGYHIEGVLIPQAPADVQRVIGEKVVLAYEKRDEATALEEAVIRELEQTLETRAQGYAVDW